MNNKNLTSEQCQAQNSSCKGSQAADVAVDATRLYLKDIGHTPLLTAEESILWAARTTGGQCQQAQNDREQSATSSENCQALS